VTLAQLRVLDPFLAAWVAAVGEYLSLPADDDPGGKLHERLLADFRTISGETS
jgi:hypothetical protein